MTEQINHPDQIQNKLAMISDLTERELRGWIDQMRSEGARKAFAGEREAVSRRARQLGVKLK